METAHSTPTGAWVDEAGFHQPATWHCPSSAVRRKDNEPITLRHKPQGVEEVRSYSKLESRKMSYYELPSLVSRVSNRRYEEGPPVYYGAIVSTLHFKDGQTVDWVVGADLKGFTEFHFVDKVDSSAEPTLQHMPDYNSDSGFFYALDLFVKEFEILRVARF